MFYVLLNNLKNFNGPFDFFYHNLFHLACDKVQQGTILK